MFVLLLREWRMGRSSRRMYGRGLVVEVGSVGFFRMVMFGRRLGLMSLLFMVLCLLKLIGLLTPLQIMAISSLDLFHFLLLESARYCIHTIHLPPLYISTIAILRLMPPKMFQEHLDHGGLEVVQI